MENTAADNKQYKFKTHIWRRLLALFLVFIMGAGAMLAWRVRIRDVGLQYVGTMLERAQQVTEENTGYLTQPMLERAWRVLKTSVFKPRKYEEFDTYASLAIARGEYAEAAQYMQGCIDTFPGGDDDALSKLWLRQGSLYTLCGENEKAIECYNKTLELKADTADAYLLRAQMKSELGMAQEAAEDLRTYETYAGSNPIVQAALGELYESIEDYASAVECYTLAIDSGSYDVKALASRGRCNILIGKSEQGREDLDRFFREGGEDETGDCYAMLGMCRMEAGDFAEAIPAFHSAIRKGYKNSDMLYSQSIACAYMIEDYDTVISDGMKAAELGEKNGADKKAIAEDYQWVGFAHFTKNEFPEAGEAFAAALKNDPELAMINYYAGVSYMTSENLEKAAEYFGTSADRGEYATVCGYNKALCLIQLERFEEAAAALEAAIEVNDDADAVKEAKTLLKDLDYYIRSMEK